MKSLFVITLFSLLTGCASLDAHFAARRADTFAASDVVLVKNFYEVRPDGSEKVNPTIVKAGYSQYRFTETRLSFKKRVASGRNMDWAVAELNRDVKVITEDVLAQEYIAAAKARGNVVKMFGAQLSPMVAKHLSHPIRHYDGDSKNPPSIEWFNLQPTLMEVTPQGKMISVFLVVYQGQSSFGADITAYPSIYYGKEVAFLESTLSSRVLKNTFIRDL